MVLLPGAAYQLPSRSHKATSLRLYRASTEPRPPLLGSSSVTSLLDSFSQSSNSCRMPSFGSSPYTTNREGEVLLPSHKTVKNGRRRSGLAKRSNKIMGDNLDRCKDAADEGQKISSDVSSKDVDERRALTKRSLDYFFPFSVRASHDCSVIDVSEQPRLALPTELKSETTRPSSALLVENNGDSSDDSDFEAWSYTTANRTGQPHPFKPANAAITDRSGADMRRSLSTDVVALKQQDTSKESSDVINNMYTEDVNANERLLNATFADANYDIVKRNAFKARVRHRFIIAAPSPFPDMFATVVFSYPCYMRLKRPTNVVSLPNNSAAYNEDGFSLLNASGCLMERNDGPASLRFKISSNLNDPSVVVNVARWAGLRRTMSTARCNLYWGKHLSPEHYELLTPFHKVNHFPGTWTLGRKDLLASRLQSMQDQFGLNQFGFVPVSFVLPHQRRQLEIEIERNRGAIWIQKPCASSCGKGIRLIGRPGEIGAKSKCVISRYIERPYLIDGYKFDLRLYVVVTSFDPLRIYMLDDGLVRFATKKYDSSPSSRSQRCVHLTNYTVNSKSKSFVRNRCARLNNVGSKWSLKALLQYFEQTKRADTSSLMQSIRDLIIRTIISVENIVVDKMKSYCCPRTACFEVFGFDVLLDESSKPWLLEVNVMPSLSSSSPLDKYIKTKLIADVFNIVGLSAIDSASNVKAVKRAETRRRKRVLGLEKSRNSNSVASKTAIQKLLNLQISPDTLSRADISLLREAEGERLRQGHLELLFPTPETASLYTHLFQVQRYNNILLRKWLSLPREKGLSLIQ